MNIEEVNVLEKRIQYLIMKASFFNVQDIDIHPGQTRLMMILYNQQGVTQSELAKILQVSNASVGTSIQRLEKAGYVEKVSNVEDLRVNNIRLSKSGIALAELVKKRMEKIIKAKFEGLTQKEIDSYCHVLSVIESNMQRYCQSPVS